MFPKESAIPFLCLRLVFKAGLLVVSAAKALSANFLALAADTVSSTTVSLTGTINSSSGFGSADGGVYTLVLVF